MAIVLEGDGTITGVTTFTTPLDDIKFDSINVTGIATASTFQAGTGVSMASPRSQQIALFTNNVEGLHLDDAGRVGIGTTNANKAADANNAKVVNAGIITANQYYGNQLTAAGVRVTGVSTFAAVTGTTGTFSSSGSFSGDLDIAADIRHIGDTNTKISFSGADTIQLTTGGSARVQVTDAATDITNDLIITDKIVHSGDTNTAIRFPSADTITAETGGSEALRVTSTQKVAIGNASPQQLLHVWPDTANTTSAYVRVTAGDRNSNTGLDIGHDSSGNGHVNMVSNGHLTLSSNNSERLVIKNTGQIGISTSNPQVLLDIVDTPVANSDRNGDDKLTIEHAGTTNINLISAADNSGFLLFSDDTRAQGYIKYDHSTDDLCVSATDDFWVRANGTESFRVVGSNGYPQFAGASDIRLTLGSTGTAGNNDSNWVRGEGANFLSNAASGYHKWEIGGAERMHLDTSGNLFLRSSVAGPRYVVLNNSGDSDTHTISNNMNWVRGNGDNLQMNCADDGFIAFETGGTERMRIHDSLYISFGTDSINPTSGGTVIEGGVGHLILSRSGTGSETMIRFNRGGSIRGSIVVATSTTYNTSSDYRLKENVTDLSDVITRLKKITPRRFNFIEDENKQLVDGFIAHEVSEAVPESVSGTKDQVATADDVASNNAKAVGEPIYQQVDYSKYVPLLTAALQEAITEIETLKSEVAALKSS